MMDDFKDSPTALVADVDCTAEGKNLCSKHEVRGYPTIKHGDPAELKDYNGGRSYEDFKKFAEENLGPTCGPGENIGLCDTETKAKIELYLGMSSGKIEGKIRKAITDYEVQVPIMKKVLAHVKKSKSEL